MALFASSGINAALSGGSELLGQLTDLYFDGTQLDYASIAYETLVGAVTSCEKGAGSKSATNLGKGTIKKTVKTFKAVNQKKTVKAAFNAYKGKAAQQARYYLRSTRKMTAGLKRNIRSTIKYNFAGGAVKFVYNKIRRWFG